MKIRGYFVFMVDGAYVAIPTLAFVEEEELKSGIVSPKGSHIQLGKKLAAKLMPKTSPPQEEK